MDKVKGIFSRLIANTAEQLIESFLPGSNRENLHILELRAHHNQAKLMTIFNG